MGQQSRIMGRVGKKNNEAQKSHCRNKEAAIVVQLSGVNKIKLRSSGGDVEYPFGAVGRRRRMFLLSLWHGRRRGGRSGPRVPKVFHYSSSSTSVKAPIFFVVSEQCFPVEEPNGVGEVEAAGESREDSEEAGADKVGPLQTDVVAVRVAPGEARHPLFGSGSSNRFSLHFPKFAQSTVISRTRQEHILTKLI